MRRRYEIQGAQLDPIEDLQNSRMKRQKDSIHSISYIIGLLFVCFIIGLYVAVYFIDGILPQALTIADEKNNPNAFIAERAIHDLKVLTDLGPRIVGTYENEVLAVDFIQREISYIQQQAHANQRLETDLQTVSGTFFLDFKPNGAVYGYGNVQNVLVKLHSKNHSTKSLLINAHFDSVPTSPGASDDGINCAIMLEILRKLSREAEPPEHNIIFLFNGAEETGLQAAHGFITQHKWAKEVDVVVNLEGAGAGGKEILFQAGPSQPWLVKYYNKVPHPNAQASAEEIFQSGIIPSDTDFRIFRDFGKSIGFDLAFHRNAYRYHTSFDGFTNIPSGSFQHAGDNLLTLIRDLANAPELVNPHGESPEDFVFYDFFGLFLISYSHSVTIALNVIVALLSTIIAVKSFHDFGLGLNKQSLKYLALTLGAILLGWIVAAVLVIITALIIDAAHFSLGWYNRIWILFGLYFAPAILCCCGGIAILNHFFNKDNLSISAQAQIQAHLLRLIWTVPLLIGTFMGIRSVYLILIPLLFQTVAAAIVMIFALQFTVRIWQIIYILGTFIPTIYSIRVMILILDFLVPISGRVGPDQNSELRIAIITFATTILTISYYFPLVTLLKKPHMFLLAIASIFLIFFIIVFTPLAFPYSGNSNHPTPQRFWIYHTSRNFRNDSNHVYKRDSGFVLLNMDRNSPNSVKKYVKDLSKAKSIEEDCKRSLFCGLPMPSSRLMNSVSTSTFIPAEQPIIQVPISLKLISKTSTSSTITRYTFSASGPSLLVLYISPRAGAKLVQTSLTNVLWPNPVLWNGRPVYTVVYAWGKEIPLTFWLDFETSQGWEGPTFDIALTGTYKDDRTNMKTPHFQQFLSEFPGWTDVMAWLGYYDSWVY